MQNLMCAQRSVTHISRQIMNSIITSVYYITNKIELSHKYNGSNKRSLAEAPFHRDVDWLTTSLVVPKKIIIPKVICYPFEIFIQIMKINKHKYMSYSTSVTWGS